MLPFLIGCDVPLVINGTVSDADKNKLVGADVRLLTKGKQELARSKSNKDGSFSFERTGTSTSYKLLVEFEGFETRELTFKNEGIKITLDIELTRIGEETSRIGGKSNK